MLSAMLDIVMLSATFTQCCLYTVMLSAMLDIVMLSVDVDTLILFGCGDIQHNDFRQTTAEILGNKSCSNECRFDECRSTVLSLAPSFFSIQNGFKWIEQIRSHTKIGGALKENFLAMPFCQLAILSNSRTQCQWWHQTVGIVANGWT
jgi:hypothetical protein